MDKGTENVIICMNTFHHSKRLFQFITQGLDYLLSCKMDIRFSFVYKFNVNFTVDGLMYYNIYMKMNPKICVCEW